MDELEIEQWEFDPHTWLDDGFAVKCRQVDVAPETPVHETSRCRGTAVCGSCDQTVAVFSVNG